MTKIQPAKIGKGKAIHAGVFTANGSWTLCRVNHTSNNTGETVVAEGEITCKKCAKELAAQIEAAHGEAVQADEARTKYRARNSVPFGVVVTVDAEQAHAEALVLDAQWSAGYAESERQQWATEQGVHLDAWTTEAGERRVCDVVVPLSGVLRPDTHEGPCYDAINGTWREEPVRPAPSRRQRRAARRDLRAKLRRTAPQTHAAARARRARRGTARATAKTLLVASGVPQEVAVRYAPAFSRGVQAPKATSTRIRTGEHRSKRIEVKRYTWCQFTERLAAYRPTDAVVSEHFARAAYALGVR